jgi:hypothetical protein
MDEADAANLGRVPTLDDDNLNALEVLRAHWQGGLGLDSNLPPSPQSVMIFTVTDSLSAQRIWVSDRLPVRHIRYSLHFRVIKSAGESYINCIW